MTFDEYIVADLIEDISMGPFGSSIKAENYQDSGVPYLTGSNLTGFKLCEESFRYVSEEKADSLRRSLAHREDIVVTHRGTLGQIVYIPNDSKFERYITGNSQFRLKCNDKVIPEYLVLFFHTPEGQGKLLSNASQVGVPALARPSTTFQQLSVKIPPVEYQQKVCAVFNSIQEKIETNNSINDNLQEQAKAIYQHIVVENADASWTSGVLSDIAVITMGQSPKGESYSEEGIGTVFFQGRAEFGFRFPTRRLFTTDPKRMALANDALMSVRAPVGDMNVAYEDCCIGRGLGSIRSKDGHQSFVFYTMLALREQLNVFNGEGTVFGSINRDALNSMPVDIPPKEIMDQFEDLVAPIDASIRNNYDESCRLQTMRDSLLPKLMSGEIDVSAITL